MIQVGNWGKMYDDTLPSDNSLLQRRRRMYYNYQQSIGHLRATQAYFEEFIEKNEKYSNELKEEMLNDFQEYVESEKEILSAKVVKRRAELY